MITQTGLAEKVPSPFIRYRCPACQRWVAEDARVCICGVLFISSTPETL